MPLIDDGTGYRAPILFRNGHLQTIYPTIFRKVEGVVYLRERIETPDGDFLDIDWSRVGGKCLTIISHGLEGNSGRAYVQGMVRAVNEARIDALAWNHRGCSGEPNRLLRMYHNGVIDDLERVISHSIDTGLYESVFLVGFSMGGNLSLLYLGKQAGDVPDPVRGAVTFSVPCDLADASRELDKKTNTIYMKRFLGMLHEKIKAKQNAFPEALDDTDYHRIKSFKAFDDRYTAPIHGFEGAEDYWEKCSCRPWLPHINIPSLIVNAYDDPFLKGGCYPVAECKQSLYVTLEIVRHGGHLGFMAFNRKKRYWSEARALRFIREQTGDNPGIDD